MYADLLTTQLFRYRLSDAMFGNAKRHSSEEDFLHATFFEFVKCWGSGARSRLYIESMNGNAFVNFSAYLGHPRKAHFESTKQTNFNERPRRSPRGRPSVIIWGRQSFRPRRLKKASERLQQLSLRRLLLAQRRHPPRLHQRRLHLQLQLNQTLSLRRQLVRTQVVLSLALSKYTLVKERRSLMATRYLIQLPFFSSVKKLNYFSYFLHNKPNSSFILFKKYCKIFILT